MLRKKRLRSGYTTGACAAAAAKAAMMLISAEAWKLGSATVEKVEIPFPDGSRFGFKIYNSKLITQNSQLVAFASVIKDAGDDPDVTNGAEIGATVRLIEQHKQEGDCPVFTGEAPVFNGTSSESKLSPTSGLIIKGGSGVGTVTKPGLPVPVGESAINPVPRKMIQEAIMEAIRGDCPGFTGEAVESGQSPSSKLEITISVTNGEELVKKTLNSRLGIIGGISILGTTGIVRPISSEAWTATIASSMDVAKAMRRDEIVISAGRSSEKAHMNRFNFSEEAYVMMGDYLEFALLEAKKHRFKKIHLCAQWAKMLKIAMAIPQTHVRHGALDTKKAVEFLLSLQPSVFSLQSFNTAREIFDFIQSTAGNQQSAIFSKVCLAAKKYAEDIALGIPVEAHLVSYEGEIIANQE